MFSFKSYLAVAKKEFLEMKRNRLFFSMTFIAPILFYLLFAYGFTLDVKGIPMAVVDFDKTAKSRELIDNFAHATDLFNIKLIVNNYPKSEKMMDQGQIRFILVIPANFSRDIQAGRNTDLQALIDGAYPSMASIIGDYVESVITNFSMQEVGLFLTTRPAQEEGGGSSSSINLLPIDLSVSTWYNSAFRSQDFIVPAILALVLMFYPPIIGAISLAREKETGSILNMYCSSLGKVEYLFGKMTPYIIITYLNLVLFLVLTIFVFEVPMRGSVAVLLVTGIFYVATAVGIGLLVAVFVNTQIAAILLTFVVTVLPSFLYTGFFVPISNMPPDMQNMSLILAPTYFIDLARKVMVKGVDILVVKTDVIMTIVFCLVVYGLAVKFFKKRIK